MFFHSYVRIPTFCYNLFHCSCYVSSYNFQNSCYHVTIIFKNFPHLSILMLFIYFYKYSYELSLNICDSYNNCVSGQTFCIVCIIKPKYLKKKFHNKRFRALHMGICLDQFSMDGTQQFQALDKWRKRLIISIAASYKLFYFL